MGDGENTPLKLDFDRKIRLEFPSATTTSDGGCIVSAIPAWCVYEATIFHLGNIRL